jgi:20S proteasome alpha/beta subunit
MVDARTFVRPNSLDRHDTLPFFPSFARTSQRTDKCVIATAGMQADQLALHKLLQTRLQWYEHQHRKPMSTPAIAQMLATILYGKRFFPYYTFNVLGGVDDNGTVVTTDSYRSMCHHID